MPNGLAATAGDAQVSLTWSPSSDNIGVSGYKVYRDGTQVASTSSTSYRDGGLANGTSDSYTVAAYDAAGNTSAQSAAVSATPAASTTQDTTPPTISLTATPPSSTTSTSANFSFTGSDNVGVSGYRCSLDGAVYSACTSPASYSGLSVSPHTFSVQALDGAGNASTPASYSWQITDSQAPSVPSGLNATAGNAQVSLSWNAATDNVGVAGYRVFRNGAQVATTGSRSYADTGLTNGNSYSYTVAAYDAAGNVSAQSSAVSATPVAPTGGTYMGQASSAACSSRSCTASSFPRSDSYCAGAINHSTWEPRSDNYSANHTQGPANLSILTWGADALNPYWVTATANHHMADGWFTGTTTEIISWAACKWGVDEDTLRAVAVKESDWHQNAQGDYANGCYHSFSIIQIRDSKNSSCPLNHDAFGGMSYTQNSTALALDFYASDMRACYDGDYYDGGSWLYGGHTVAYWASLYGWDYVKWGCVGAWFSGNWYDSGAKSYISSVKQWLANKTWLGY